jgi:hypothetical protein
MGDFVPSQDSQTIGELAGLWNHQPFDAEAKLDAMHKARDLLEAVVISKKA